MKEPMVLGHESSGVIVEVGSGVTSLKVGDRVAMEPGQPCYHCSRCKEGTYHLCYTMKFGSTPPFDGTLGKYYALSADLCYKLPDNVSLEEGALTEPTAVAVHAVRQGGFIVGNRVIVFGAGPVGLLCAGVAKGFGARKVVVIDIQDQRLEFARNWVLGGCETFKPAQVEPAENAKKLQEQLNWDEGADVVLECTGSESCIKQGLHMLRKGGTYVQVGMGKPDVVFPIMSLCTGELTVKGSFRYKEGDYRIALDLIERGVLDVKRLISRTVAFQDAEQAFKDSKAGKGIKFLIEGIKADGVEVRGQEQIKGNTVKDTGFKA